MNEVKIGIILLCKKCDQGWATPVLEGHCPAEIYIANIYTAYLLSYVD